MSPSHARIRGRGALLLEVVVALTIMVAALGVMAAQLVGGLRMTVQAERATRAGRLTDRLLAMLELDPEIARRFFEERETDGDFGPQHPGYFWRAAIEPVDLDLPGLGLVTLDILYQEDPDLRDTIEGARIVRRTVLLKAEPGCLDLERDLGLSQEEAELVSSLFVDLEDPGCIYPQQLVSQLSEMMQDPNQFAAIVADPQLQAALMTLAFKLGPAMASLGFDPGAMGGGGGPGGGTLQIPDGLRDQLGALGGQLGDLPLDDLLQQVGGGQSGTGDVPRNLDIRALQELRDRTSGDGAAARGRRR